MLIKSVQYHIRKQRVMSVLKLFLLLALVLSFSLAGLAQADGPALGSKEDNACNEGGSMSPGCTSDWAWSCGWYLARFQSGLYSRAQVPATCAILLPPLPVPAAPAAPAATGPFCVFVFGPNYVNFFGGFSLSGPTRVYSDPACAVPSTLENLREVYIGDGRDPNAACQEFFGTNVLTIYASGLVARCN
jgi:hypothetical protein